MFVVVMNLPLKLHHENIRLFSTCARTCTGQREAYRVINTPYGRD